MKKIVITGGRYGYISPEGAYSAKTSESKPFEVEDKEAERLVNLGVAKIFGEHEKRAEGEKATPSKGSTPTDDENDHIGENEGAPVYDLTTPVDELRKIGKSVGISFKVGTKKEDMVAALDEYFAANDIEDDADDIDDDDEFELSAADPIE